MGYSVFGHDAGNKHQPKNKDSIMNNDLIHKVIIVLLLATSLSGCSKSDDEVYIDIPSEDVFTQIRDSVRVDFNLLNERGDTTTVFHEGEDIIFDLSIWTSANCPIEFGSDKELLGKDVFRVFSSKGKDLGTAGIFTELNLFPYGSLVKDYPLKWQYSWFGRFRPKYPFSADYYRNALPKGDYYTIAPIHIHNINVIICSIHFTIQ